MREWPLRSSGGSSEHTRRPVSVIRVKCGSVAIRRQVESSWPALSWSSPAMTKTSEPQARSTGSLMRYLLQEAEAYVISFRSAGSGCWRSRVDETSARYNSAPRAETRKNFFIWIPRNPLKSPESAKGIQGNPSLFPWFYLVFRGNSRAGCIEAACTGVGRARLDQKDARPSSAGNSASVLISKSGLPGRRSRRWP